MPPYLLGNEICATSTDRVVIDNHSTVTTAKSPPTPAAFARSPLDAMAPAAVTRGPHTDPPSHRLAAKGCQARALCFRRSSRNPDTGRPVKALVQRFAPDLFVTCPADLVPKWGEYERATAVPLNGYIGPLTSTYLRNLDRQI